MFAVFGLLRLEAGCLGSGEDSGWTAAPSLPSRPQRFRVGLHPWSGALAGPLQAALD